VDALDHRAGAEAPLTAGEAGLDEQQAIERFRLVRAQVEATGTQLRVPRSDLVEGRAG